jgi:predicted flap endonuclease-1-like 5' DNA nuclease
MSFLIGHYIVWIFVALFLGVIVAWMATGKGRGTDKTSSYWLVLGVIAFAIFVAFTHAVPGRIGHGLEVALLLLVSYLLGCLLGEPLRLLFGAPPKTAQAVAGPMNAGPMNAEPAIPQQMVAAASQIPEQTRVYAREVMPSAASSALQFAAEPPVSDDHKPVLFNGPPSQGADDLKLIWGVGPKLETLLNELGVYRFDQIASWNDLNLRWVDQSLDAFKGRAVRDRWIEQSKKLAGGWRPDSQLGEKFES